MSRATLAQVGVAGASIASCRRQEDEEHQGVENHRIDHIPVGGRTSHGVFEGTALFARR